MNTQRRASRHVSAVSIANGAKYHLRVNGDYFFIHAQSGVLTVSVNGDEFTPCQAGQLQQGTVGNDDFFEVVFQNTSVAAVTLTVIFGRGAMLVVGTVTLSAADIASITPTAATVQVDVETVTNASQVFSSKTSIAIYNTGAADITVNTRTIAPGDNVIWSSLRQQDVLESITVDATGSEARVVWTS